MALSMEKIAKNKVRLTIEVDADTFEDGLETAYRKTRNNYRAPGFRKGRAPRKVIESHYGEGVFFEDAFKELMPVAYEAAVTELELEPVERPFINIESIGRNEKLVFTAEVHIMPEVSLGQYKGIEVEKAEYNVSDAEVQAKVDQALEKAARYIEVERPVQDGDRVILDYTGTIGGNEFQGGSAENATLDIGSGQFIPGFEEQIIGMNRNEEKDIEVTFPENYPAEEFAGKEAVFHITLHEAKQKELPEFDDEFVKDISDTFDTVEEYLADIRQKLAEEGEKTAQSRMEEAALNTVIDNASVDIPDCMVEDQLDTMVQDLRINLAGSGMRLEDFFQYAGSSIEQYRENYRDEALRRIKGHLVIQAVRNAEGIEADEESVQEKIGQIATNRRLDPEEYKKRMQPREMEYIKDTVAIDKTIGLIMEKAVYIQPEPETGDKEEPAPQDEANG